MNIQRQKRIAVVNDVTGFGRCSVSVALPIISAMKLQCCPLPTAILSTNTAFPNFFIDDYTPHMRKYMKHWQEMNIAFDGICTGFLGSKEQIDLVIEFIEMFKTEQTMTIIDPVMGDYGKLYSSITQGMCDEMRRLMKYADVMTPNLTEACQLLDLPYPKQAPNDDELEGIAQKLCENGPSKIVITGLQYDGKIKNFIYEQGKNFESVYVNKIGEDRSGTGDVFTSIVAASLIKGEDLTVAVKKAADFISKTIKYTVELNTPVHDGICFEEYLNELK